MVTSPPSGDVPEPLVVGWREWVRFPELDLPPIKAKIDTGARTSALHAFDVTRFRRGGRRMVRFKVHPVQRDAVKTAVAEAEYVGERRVRASSGHQTLRPVIRTQVEIRGQRWPIEITLASRDEMGFRMLLGRHAIRHRFVVDPGRSFLGGRLKKRKKRRSAG